MTLPNWAARVISRSRAQSHLVFLFDFDGTLTPIVSHPSLASLSSQTRDALETLARLEGVKAGIISGRTLPDLRELIGLPGLWFAGSGGMQLELGGEKMTDPALVEFEKNAKALCEEIANFLKRFPETWLERKPGCLTAHFRALAPQEAPTFVHEMRTHFVPWERGDLRLKMIEVDKGLEICLANSWGKGEAVEHLLESLGGDPFVLYAGNAANDEAAMQKVNARGGITVGIGPEAPAIAHEWVATPQEFTGGLAALAEELIRERTRPLHHFLHSLHENKFLGVE